MVEMRLRNGHIAYYKAASDTEVSVFYVIAPHRKLFLMGCANVNADKKYNHYSKLGTWIVSTTPILPNDLDFSNLLNKLGSMRNSFSSVLHRDIRDNMAKSAGACSDRYAYWEMSRLNLQNNGLGLPLWALLAHHLHIFSTNVEFTLRGHTYRHGNRYVSLFKQNLRRDTNYTGFRAPSSYLAKAAPYGFEYSYNDW